MASIVLVTSRQPNDSLWRELVADPEALAAAGIRQVERIGDCRAPATIAAAVHNGHLFARTLQAAYTEDTGRDRVLVA